MDRLFRPFIPVARADWFLGGGLLAAALFIASAVMAAGQPFDRAAFVAAQQAGRSILVDVTAPWCPTCQKQKPIIDSLTQAEPFSGMAVFDVDFDSAKDVLRELRVQYQSTLIVFKGTEEKARSTGVTDPAAIRALLEQGL